MPVFTLTHRDPVMATGAWARSKIANAPWGSGLGLGRTVLALGTLGTLLATPPQVLLSPMPGGVTVPACVGLARASIWCVLPGNPQLARWLSVAVLAAVASGWRPRLTTIPHWWVSWSLFASVSIQDGGDQITAVLTLLLIPLALTDPRRWHWQPTPPGRGGPLPRIIGVLALLLIQIQVAAVYLDAGIAKLGVPDWANGTAMFYIFRNAIYGAPSWLSPMLSAITNLPVGVALLTWGAVVLEVILGLALLLPRQLRPLLLAAGLLFHDMIALSMGLISFDLAMSAALLLYLLPTGCQLTAPNWLARAKTHLTAREQKPLGPPAAVIPGSASSAPGPHGS
jgi:antimicrobial peptide system SdpB family protein